jgi:hypothetical protein
MGASLPQAELDRLRTSLEGDEPEAQLAALRALDAAGNEGHRTLRLALRDDVERRGSDGWTLSLMAYAPTEPALIRTLVSHLNARWAIGPFCCSKQQARDRFVELFALLAREDLEAMIEALFPEKGFSNPHWVDFLASIVGPDGMVPLIPKLVERARSDDWGVWGASSAFSRVVGPRATAWRRTPRPGPRSGPHSNARGWCITPSPHGKRVNCSKASSGDRSRSRATSLTSSPSAATTFESPTTRRMDGCSGSTSVTP